MKIAHIINPVNAPAGSELAAIQPVTLESIRVAKEFAQKQLAIELYAVGYPEDQQVVPDYFIWLPPLQRSVLDLGKFSRPKKYPLITDVFSSVANASNAEYLMFTNMDIALMPHFYAAVSELLKHGYDALVINRRGISKKYKGVEQLPLMYSDYGMPHPGFDCFIFRRELLHKLVLADICAGVSFSETALVHNFIAFADKFKLIDDLHLTFHIGTEVMPPLDPEYYNHNRTQYEQHIYPQIKVRLDIRKFPYAEFSLPKRVLKWALNPSFRTKEVLQAEGIQGWRAFKYKLDALRFALMERLK
jgi:hypothetical protein